MSSDFSEIGNNADFGEIRLHSPVSEWKWIREMHALILVDLQNDFIEGGALPVPAGKDVIPMANKLQPHFNLVVATQDWHSAEHESFASQHPDKQPGDVIDLYGLEQILWPDHCVQGSHGAEFVAELDTERVAQIFKKGTDQQIDSYSGFFDNGHRKATGLGDYLRERNVTNVYVLGLATDYCVKFTALDAHELGFKTSLIEDACRGVELQPGDCRRAIQAMQAAGVTLISSGDI